jgi:hypothetical protein
MTKDERIRGLIEANNLNIQKRRGLANMLRILLPYHNEETQEIIKAGLKLNGPS